MSSRLTKARYDSRLKNAYHDIDVARANLFLAKLRNDDYEAEEELNFALEAVDILKLAWQVECMKRRVDKMGELGMLPAQIEKGETGSEPGEGTGCGVMEK